ncbi:MAG TPA: histidine phosphatase family protein [Candidatus Sericytochromatia bacterium]|jgi:broad specificity phosphatase PhoE
MTQIVWIARHGNRLDFVNPEWFNTAERPYDPPLSEDGIVQAKQLGQRLVGEKIKQIFASPFLRTVQTANCVADLLDLPIKLESGLSEWLNPAWMKSEPEKLSLDELHKLFPRIDRSYTSRVIAHYPETIENVLERTAETAKYLTTEFSEDILLVGHGASVVGTTQGLVGGMPEVNATLCCLVKLLRQEQEWVMELNGDTSHLSETEDVIRFN